MNAPLRRWAFFGLRRGLMLRATLDRRVNRAFKSGPGFFLAFRWFLFHGKTQRRSVSRPLYHDWPYDAHMGVGRKHARHNDRRHQRTGRTNRGLSRSPAFPQETYRVPKGRPARHCEPQIPSRGGPRARCALQPSGPPSSRPYAWRCVATS